MYFASQAGEFLFRWVRTTGRALQLLFRAAPRPQPKKGLQHRDHGDSQSLFSVFSVVSVLKSSFAVKIFFGRLEAALCWGFSRHADP